MSELRDKATRLLLKSAWEMADDNEDELSAVFDGQHGFTDDLRRRAIDTLEGVGCMPSTPPDNDEMERLIADSGLSLDVLDKRARGVSMTAVIPPRISVIRRLSSCLSMICWEYCDGSQDIHGEDS